jgi:hypothetical protein
MVLRVPVIRMRSTAASELLQNNRQPAVLKLTEHLLLDGSSSAISLRTLQTARFPLTGPYAANMAPAATLWLEQISHPQPHWYPLAAHLSFSDPFRRVASLLLRTWLCELHQIGTD